MDGDDAIKELRQISHEILEDVALTSSHKWVVNAIHGWMAQVWATNLALYPPVKVPEAQTMITTLTFGLGSISARFQSIDQDIKIYIDAPGFTASRSEHLAEPNSIHRAARWLDEAMRFALRDIQFPA